MKFLIRLLTILFLFNSCEKEKMTCTCFECPEFPSYNNSPPFTSVLKVGVQYYSPCFNPNNSNQFLYCKNAEGSNLHELYIRDLSNGLTTLIYSGSMFVSPPKWGGGKIVFSELSDYLIKSIDVNGQNLTIEYNSAYNLYPELSDDGNSLVWLNSQVLGHPYYLLKKNLQNGVIDTIRSNYYVGNIDLNSNGSIIGDVYYNSVTHMFGMVDTMGQNTTPFINVNDEGVFDLSWDTSNQGFYFIDDLNKSIQYYNISTGEIEEILCVCDSRKFKSVSVSQDGTKLLCELEYRSIIVDGDSWDGVLRTYSRIVIIDLNNKSLNELAM